MLPITLQMEIDLSAAAHKREIAEGFAKLRAKLLPPMEKDNAMARWQELMAGLGNVGMASYNNMRGNWAHISMDNPFCRANEVSLRPSLSQLAGF
jgi:hypothetical protein